MKTIDGDIYDDDADIDIVITIDIDIVIDEDIDDNEDDCSVIEVPRPILIINWWLADISSLLSWNNMFDENDVNNNFKPQGQYRSSIDNWRWPPGLNNASVLVALFDKPSMLKC